MASRFAGLHPLAGPLATCELPADPAVPLRMADGGEASFPLRRIQARQVTAAVPWRETRSARGQVHYYPGYFWSATLGSHVVYESHLELAPATGRLRPSHRGDRGAAVPAAGRRWRRARRRVPDFLLVHADWSVRVVNVKPADRLADPRIGEALAWPRLLFQAHGWENEI